MDAMSRIERTLAEALAWAEAPGGPPRLAEAMHYAVFPRGARIRPRLALSVAHACGDDNPALANAGAAAIELLHCASLVHDDLPCFDNAGMRRGKASVHRAFGEQLAVLSGDALIVLAFQAIARAATANPERLPALLLIVGNSVGVPKGIVAGQAWECEPQVDLAEYQQEKTGALFAAATMAGAAASGADAAPWRSLGEHLGEAYQVADDLRDATCDAEELGKPVGQDTTHGRPSAVTQFGVAGAVKRLQGLAAGAVASIPSCPGAADLQALILLEAKRLMPEKLAQRAA